MKSFVINFIGLYIIFYMLFIFYDIKQAQVKKLKYKIETNGFLDFPFYTNEIKTDSCGCIHFKDETDADIIICGSYQYNLFFKK